MATATVTPVVSSVGYQRVGLSTVKTSASTTGLGTGTQYYFKITKDGGTLTELSITTPGSGSMTYAVVLPLLNAAIMANATLKGAYFALTAAGDLACYSNTVGANSSIGLAAGQATDLFATLTDWVATGFMSPIQGSPLPDVSERYITVQGALSFGAVADDEYVTGGLTLSFAGVGGQAHNAPPVWVDIKSLGPASTGSTLSNTYVYCPGSTVANGKLKIFGSNNATTVYKANTEMTNSLNLNDATALVSQDRVVFIAKFRKGA